MELALLIALLASNAAWLLYNASRDRRTHELEQLHRDQVSELTSRIQHPQLVNPRALEDALPPPPEQQPDELELAGQTFHDGLPERLRASLEE